MYALLLPLLLATSVAHAAMGWSSPATKSAEPGLALKPSPTLSTPADLQNPKPVITIRDKSVPLKLSTELTLPADKK